MGGKIVIAADLGASGGKMAKGYFDGNKLHVDEFFDFPNQPMELNGNLYWNLFGLYNSILEGMSYYAKGHEIEAVSIDTWGASYGLLDKRGRLLEPVYHYRDLRTRNSVENLYKVLPKRKLFAMTGCQPNRTYTLPQLYSYIEHNDKILDLAECMLFLPDLLEYFLSGVKSTERSIAGTSGMLMLEQNDWAFQVLDTLRIQNGMLMPLVDAGTQRGTVLKNIAEATGTCRAKVIAAAGHDTAAAVLGIPDFGINQLYISMGTNVNMGTELMKSNLSEKAYRGGYKNAGVLDGRKILYRDFSAFWILNELRRIWITEGKHYDYSAIMEMVINCESKHVYIDVEETSINNPEGNMKDKMNRFLAGTGQKLLNSDAEFARCILESIALKIKYCFEYLKDELSIPLHRVSVINGGSRNYVLMQMISDALEMPVFCGMPYATLTGNILTQFYSLQELKTVDEIRELSAHSFEMKEYQPRAEEKAIWDMDLQSMVEKGIFK